MKLVEISTVNSTNAADAIRNIETSNSTPQPTSLEE
jgi:hypothetical protein